MVLPANTPPEKLSERELLTHLRRSVALYRDPNTEPWARASLGNIILGLIKEARRRQYVMHIYATCAILHTEGMVEMQRPGGAIATLTTQEFREHVFFHLLTQAVAANGRGMKKLYEHYAAGYKLLLRLWKVERVDAVHRKLYFKQEVHESDNTQATTA